MAEVVDSQADTQPASGVNTQSQQVPDVDSWAKLVLPFIKSPSNIWVTKEFSRFGKLPFCEISVNDLCINPQLVQSVSKIQFVIEKRCIRGTTVGYIKDLSSNGTFINGEKIGKDGCRVLGHKDTISVVKGEFKTCKFYYLNVDNQPSLKLPEQVTINYHVVENITSGQFNEVFYAIDRKSCQPAAMKFCPNLSLNIHRDDGLLTEVKVLRAVQHANIIRYFNHILLDHNLFLFVQYMDGGDLSQYLSRKGRLSEPAARTILKQVLAGVEYLHGLKIAHRNIQPKNILLDSNENNPTVKIKNFRFSKKLRKGDSSGEKVGVAMGIYDAPEIKNRARFDLRVDVYSFGVLMYVCLSGREPTEGPENTAGGVVHYSPKDVWSQISFIAKKVIEASLNVDFQQRFHSTQLAMLPWFSVNLQQTRKRPNILSSNNSTPKRFKSNIC